MDFQQDIYTSPAPQENKRSDAMALASIVLGSTALLTCGCIYLALICGALGIILALLSRGGCTTMDTRAKIGLTLSSIGLALTIVFYTVAIVSALIYYGGMDGIMKEAMHMYGADTLEELYQIMGMPY